MQHIIHKITRKIVRNVETSPQSLVSHGWIWAKWGDGKITLYDNERYEPLPTDSQRLNLDIRGERQ